MQAPYTATTVAKWFVDWANSDDAELSNLKLQKLLYYAQGHHFATHGTALFSDAIQAWSHGPVVPAVYHAFKHFGSGPISLLDNDPFEWDHVDPATSQFLARVWNTYGGVAAWKLRNMTHAEAPWVEHFSQGERHVVIPQDEIAAYFRFRAS